MAARGEGGTRAVRARGGLGEGGAGAARGRRGGAGAGRGRGEGGAGAAGVRRKGGAGTARGRRGTSGTGLAIGMGKESTGVARGRIGGGADEVEARLESRLVVGGDVPARGWIQGMRAPLGGKGGAAQGERACLPPRQKMWQHSRPVMNRWFLQNE